MTRSSSKKKVLWALMVKDSDIVCINLMPYSMEVWESKKQAETSLKRMPEKNWKNYEIVKFERVS